MPAPPGPKPDKITSSATHPPGRPANFFSGFRTIPLATQVNLSLLLPRRWWRTRHHGGGPTPGSGGGRGMLASIILLTLGLEAAEPRESPAELAAWIDARLEAAWRA